jgi:conjugal transfer pilin signal peptidase TrbI
MIALSELRIEVHTRARTKRFWVSVALGLVFIALAAAFIATRFRIGISNEAEQSVGSMFTLVHLQRGPVSVGAYGVFLTDARVKAFPPNTEFVKLIVGGPGDLVRVDADATKVNGRIVAGPLDSLSTLGLKASDVERTFILGPDEYFAVGTRPHSYDSRYWGPVHASQFVGRGTLL